MVISFVAGWRGEYHNECDNECGMRSAECRVRVVLSESVGAWTIQARACLERKSLHSRRSTLHVPHFRTTSLSHYRTFPQSNRIASAATILVMR